MTLVSDIEQEQWADLESEPGYHPNPCGRFEINASRYEMTLGFPDPRQYGSKVVKLFCDPWGPLTGIVAGSYQIIWLHRPATERWASIMRAHKKYKMCWQPLAGTEMGDFFKNYRDVRVQEGLAILRQRKDVRITEVDYASILEHPSALFWELAAAGWPLNPDKAAVVPDRTLKRF